MDDVLDEDDEDPQESEGPRRTEDEPFWGPIWSRDALLDPSSFPPAGKPESTAARFSEDEPTEEEAEKLLGGRGEHGYVDSAFYKAAKSALVGRDYFPEVFENILPDVDEGDRHDTLLKWASSIIGILVGRGDIPDLSAAAIYALLRAPAVQMDKDPNELWRMVTHVWKEEQKHHEEKVKQEVAAVQEKIYKEVEASDIILAGIGEWPSKPVFSDNSVKKWNWAKARMIANVSKTHFHYILGRNGYYASTAVLGKQVIPQIKHMGMDVIIPLTVPRLKGEGGREVQVDEILSHFSVNVDRVSYRPEIKGAYLEDHEKANPTLVLPAFRRNPKLTARYDPGVDEFLFHFAGKTRSGRSLHEVLNKQIGCFVAFERGAVCLMSVKAPPDSGKKLMAHGFMEVLEVPRIALGADLVGKFNSSLIYTPFVLLNEGLPEGRVYHVSDTIRRMVTGDCFEIEEKFFARSFIQFPFRIIMTANNYKILLAMAENRDLDPDDRAALAQRIQHYEPGDGAARFLRGKGGGKWTEGWIKGDGSGDVSQFIVARHFLWLYEKYGKDAKPVDKHNLLLAGDVECVPMDLMRTQGGSTPVVIEALAKIMNSPMGAVDGTHGVMVWDGNIYVIPGPPLDYWREHLTKGSSDRLTLRKVKSALTGLQLAGGLSGEDPHRIDGKQQRWIQMDVALLAEEIERAGWKCPKIHALALARRAGISLKGHECGPEQTHVNGTTTSHTTQFPAELGR